MNIIRGKRNRNTLKYEVKTKIDFKRIFDDICRKKKIRIIYKLFYNFNNYETNRK